MHGPHIRAEMNVSCCTRKETDLSQLDIFVDLKKNGLSRSERPHAQRMSILMLTCNGRRHRYLVDWQKPLSRSQSHGSLLTFKSLTVTNKVAAALLVTCIDMC